MTVFDVLVILSSDRCIALNALLVLYKIARFARCEASLTDVWCHGAVTKTIKDANAYVIFYRNKRRQHFMMDGHLPKVRDVAFEYP